MIEIDTIVLFASTSGDLHDRMAELVKKGAGVPRWERFVRDEVIVRYIRHVMRPRRTVTPAMVAHAWTITDAAKALRTHYNDHKEEL